MSEPLFFPHPYLANSYGLLAVGGDLSPQRLLLAYQFGFFPWFSEGQEILWWSPDPRCVLYPDKLKVSKSMRNLMRKKPFRVTVDESFEDVIKGCSKVPRKGQHGTWITKDMITAYIEMHHLGHAHSVEVWQNENLVGGLYGMAWGKIFFGESMFSLVPNASKYGFISLVNRLRDQAYIVIDCQQETPHLMSLGAEMISRNLFMRHLRRNQLHSSEAAWLVW